MKFENKKGSALALVKTRGIEPGSYDLYDIRGLTLGKLDLIIRGLEGIAGMSTLAMEILAMLKRDRDEHQTIGDK